MSQDPIGFAAGDTNLSRYVGNTPTKYVDPSGLEPSEPPKPGYWWDKKPDEDGGFWYQRPDDEKQHHTGPWKNRYSIPDNEAWNRSYRHYLAPWHNDPGWKGYVCGAVKFAGWGGAIIGVGWAAGIGMESFLEQV